MYNVIKVSELVGARYMETVAKNVIESQAKAIIKDATDRDFYSYYKVKIG